MSKKNIEFSSIIFGSGSQGVVRKACLRGTTVAVETMTNLSSKKLIIIEIKITKKIRHQNFINIMSVCITPQKFHIIMEYFECYTLEQV